MRKRLAVLVIAAASLAAPACSSEPGRGSSRAAVPVEVDPADTRELASGHAYADTIVALARRAEDPAATPAAVAVAAGYLERLRLGAGSPFRLVETALRDRRMPDTMRTRLAWALLARTHRGESHRIDPAALDWIGGGGVPAWRGIGDRHLALIDSVVSASRQPREGEVAVRLAYLIVAAEQLVSSRAPGIAAEAAALLGDRALAMRDARALLRAARAAGLSPLALVPRWRETRRFTVERPPLERASRRAGFATIDAVPALVERLRGFDRPGGDEPAHQQTDEHLRPVLGAGVAARLARVTRRQDAPPQSPVIVPLRMAGATVRGKAEEDGYRARARFLRYARTEESLAAEHALAVAGERTHAGLALGTLRVLAALRPYAQEAVWLPGSGGPTARELQRKYGLAQVSFDADVPTVWRPYYLNMIDAAVADLQRVLPEIRTRGLGVHVGASPLGSAALAAHLPSTRTLFIPPATGAGTLAHELAHDLDWYAVRRGGYATDRAIREGQAELAAVLARLGADSLAVPSPEHPEQAHYSRRPTEVFARSADWFVAATLARQGRANGYLSTVQDELLTGYTTVPPPDVFGQAGEAIVELLEGMTHVPAEVRAGFLAVYGAHRETSTYDDVRRLLELPAPERVPAGPGAAARSQLSRRLVQTLAVLDWGAAPCDASEQSGEARLAAARRRVIELAATARATSIVRGWAARPPAANDAPAVQMLRGAPWSSDLLATAVAVVRNELVAGLAAQHAARSSIGALAAGGWAAGVPAWSTMGCREVAAR